MSIYLKLIFAQKSQEITEIEGAKLMNGNDKVKRAVEAFHPGCVVTQMSDLSGLPADVTDRLMVSIVNSGPPMTHPDLLAAKKSGE
jgi:hypothetical protein